MLRFFEASDEVMVCEAVKLATASFTVALTETRKAPESWEKKGSCALLKHKERIYVLASWLSENELLKERYAEDKRRSFGSSPISAKLFVLLFVLF
jgi:hypothetical protein